MYYTSSFSVLTRNYGALPTVMSSLMNPPPQDAPLAAYIGDLKYLAWLKTVFNGLFILSLGLNALIWFFGKLHQKIRIT